jgi:hypothetical protein
MSSEPQATPESTQPESPASSGDGPLPSAVTPPQPSVGSGVPGTNAPASTEAKAGAAVQTTPKLKIAAPPRKKWAPPAAPSTLNKFAWRLVFAATLLAVVLLGVIIVLMVKTDQKTEDGQPQLAEEFRNPSGDYLIKPPINWWLQDPHDQHNFYIKGPRERGYMPLITICMDVAPGRLESYVKEYKDRLQVEDKSIQFLSDTIETLNGIESERLVYTWTMINDDKTEVKVRTLQYIVGDVPRFYRVTSSVRDDLFEKYLARFEASSKTFKLTPLSAPVVRQLPPE